MSDQPIAVPTWSEARYSEAPGLSQSGLKDLAVSPLRFWHRWLDPERIEELPTPAMELGTALHCRVLEPVQFGARYACAISPEDFEGCLVTMEDLRGFLTGRDIKPKGTRKAEVAAQVLAVEAGAPIFDHLLARYAEENAGKTILSKEFWGLVDGMAKSLLDEPRLRELLADGAAEVEYSVAEPETGVLLKARMDWVTPDLIVDLKTFSQARGKSIDDSVKSAIFYEAYYRQAYFYSLVRTLSEGGKGCKYDMVMPFVESDTPHEVRLVQLYGKISGDANLYWLRAALETRTLLRIYAECMDHFGADKPWRYAQEIAPLTDQDLPQLAWS